ncbi:hypothetical protein ACLB1E_26390 [Escherichia coli]
MPTITTLPIQGRMLNSQRSLWASFNGGINLGAWQYRQLSNMTWDNDKGNQWNRS